jgi:DNA repair protein RadC
MQTTTTLRSSIGSVDPPVSPDPFVAPVTAPDAPPPIVRAARGSATDRASHDPDACDTSDLIAIVLGGDARRARAQACEILARFELAALSRASRDHLARETGLPRPAAQRLSAAFALGRRAVRTPRAVRSAMRSPALVHELMASELAGLEQETFHVLLLDGKHRLRRRQRVSEGTLTTSLVHPREVFGPALREGAAAIICVHNHPSGDPEPSREDVEVTRRLIDAGRLLGVPLLDHVVVADEGFVSLRERMSFES